MLAPLKTALILFALALTLTSNAPTAVAAASVGAAPSPTASPKKLDAIVVTAQRHAESIRNTPRHTFLIVDSELRRAGAQTAADILRFSSGTVVQQYGALGSLATVALRGASSAETLVLINGHPVNEADTGLFDFSSLPASVIARIEVVEGGSSTLYGSAAVGGVINVITKQPGSSHEVDAFVQQGYQGAFDRGIGFSLGDERALAVRVDAESSAANNVFTYPAFAGAQPGGTRRNDDATLKNTAVSLAHLFGATRGVLNLDVDASSAGAPGNVAFASDFARQQRVYQRAAFELDAPLSGGELALQMYSDSRRLRFFDPSFQFDTHSNGTFRGSSLRLTHAFGPLHLLTAGWDSKGDVALFDAGSPGQVPSVVRDSMTAWYVQDEVHRANTPFSATVGLRNERIQGTKSTTTPSLGLLEHLSAHADVSANYSRAFRAPSLDERYYPFYGNPLLQPEYGATFDAGFRAEANGVSGALAWFGSDTNNLIVNVPIDPFGNVAPFNVNRAKIRGLEGSLQATLANRLGFALAYTDFLEAADLTPSKPATRLQYRPSATGSLRLWRDHETWSYGAQVTFVGKRFADEANTRLLPAYYRSGIYVQRTLGARAALTLRVDNLEDNRVAEDQFGYPVIGRTISVRLATR